MDRHPTVRRSYEPLFAFLLVLLVVGCGEEDASSPAVGLSVPLGPGGFIPQAGVADLRASPANPLANPALWLPQPAVAREGWWLAGRGWHPLGGRSTLRFWHRAAGGSALVLEFTLRRDAPRDRYQIGVSLNGEGLGTLDTSSSRMQNRLYLPLGLLAGVNDIELDFDPPVEVVEGLPHLSLLRVGVEGESEAADRPPSSSGYRLTAAAGVEIDRSGVYLLPCDVPDRAAQVELRARGLAESLASYRLFVLQGDGRRIDLLAGQLTGGEWQEQAASVTAFRGQSVVLGWQVDLTGIGSRVELGELRFRPGPAAANSSPSIPGPPGAAAERPDVLLIVLDAARGDRFPGWDYPRRTMPMIEELGGQSLSFRYAFSECPTTSCSIPAMITGIPFLPGGQVGGGQQLADDVKTLAEHLAELGYHTVGLSASPNNSASRNMDQGFRVFHELWGRNNPHHGPFNLSRLARQVIDAQPADEPLFLQLHYLPPHQPYEPGPEFDRFTDPEYSGPIQPQMSLKPYSLGLEDLEGEDLQHLIGLYDGNLSVADAAVGEVLAALRSAGRFDNTMIVITSDHGEAFMEHDRQGHNTTLFDEMLHVPLLVRLPEGKVPESVDQDRLASALDIVPTVLGYVGTSPQPEVGGLDLLHTQPDPLRPRVLFFRTSHPKNAMLAARTPSWKAISWPRHQVQMLFHLVDDPEEEENLLGERPLVYAGLGLRLRHHLMATPGSQLQGEEVELTEEAKEALRALGYLN